jgi:carboxyl-terminal processing protease
MRWKPFLTPLILSASLTTAGGLWERTASATNDSADAVKLGLSKKINPQAIYDRVWRLIENDFYQSDFNKQNWRRWEHKYDGKLLTLDDAHKAIETMLASLNDHYTRFLDRDAFDDEKQQIDAKLCGIGVQIGIDKQKKVVVIAPIEGTPAFKAGVQAADEIAEIDGKTTKGFSVEDAAKHIRGDANTSVRLTLMRGKEKEKEKEKVIITVTRAEIQIKAVQTAKMLDSDVGYIRLSSFISQQANQEVKDALGKLASAKGIIFDLRDNPGGLLTNAIEISNMFLDKGNIVSTVDRDGYKQQQPSDGKSVCRQPVVVLINKGSASASEITSGALRDNGRATLVGQTTFGKGLVQGINKLEDGSGVNVTIARYLTPNDTDINKKGIGPDVVVELTEKELKDHKGPWWEDPDLPNVKRSPEDLKDLQLKAAIQVLKKKIDDDQTPLAIRAQAMPAKEPCRFGK